MISIQTRGVRQSRISVSQTDSVRDVLKSLGLPSCKVLYEGLLLQPAFSLMFYGIKNDSVIDIIEVPSKPKYDSPPSQYQFKKTMEQLKMRNQELEYREAYRVADNFHRKLESNRKTFRKIIEKVLKSKSNVEADDLNYPVFIPTILPNKALMPSTELLPTHFT